jgi:hypothetical protein
MKPLLLVPIILATFLHISTFNVLGTENINLFPNDWETDSGIGSIPSRCKGNRRRSLEYLWSIIIMKVVFENLEYSEITLFTSELASGGYVSWTNSTMAGDGSVGNIDFIDVKWDFITQSFGVVYSCRLGRSATFNLLSKHF